NLPYFLVADIFKVQGKKCSVGFIQVPDGIMHYIIGFSFRSAFAHTDCVTMIIFQRGLLYGRFSKCGDRGIQTYPIHPGAKLRFFLKLRVGFPKLIDDFLKKVLTVFLAIPIRPAYFMYKCLMGEYQLEEFFFVPRHHCFWGVNPDLNFIIPNFQYRLRNRMKSYRQLKKNESSVLKSNVVASSNHWTHRPGSPFYGLLGAFQNDIATIKNSYVLCCRSTSSVLRHRHRTSCILHRQTMQPLWGCRPSVRFFLGYTPG